MNTNIKIILISSVLAGAILALALIPIGNTDNEFHSAEELDYFKAHNMLVIDTINIFPTSATCFGCHSYDSLGLASVDAQGNDVNVYDDWEATMMANSAKDPFWRAKVSHEVLVNPSHSEDLQTKCTSCHAPMGHYQAILRGHEHYTMDDLLQDTIGLDGVSCGACHMISADQNGELFSGEINFDTTKTIYGPYPVPFASPMTINTGFLPFFSEHIGDAGLCASCHTLITETVDLDGNYTGDTFVEQATYHEWLNSTYNTDNVTCQGCHMPQILDDIIISSNYQFLNDRSPFGLHELVGANTFMLKLMKENREALGIQASEANFDTTINTTLRMLQEQTMDMSVELLDLDVDSAYFAVELFNKAGHKFPSGYPSRRAFIEFIVLTENGDTLFQSGVLDQNYEVNGQDDYFEEHWEVITSEDQVQIYELVLGDVNNDLTTVLERSAVALKDNRLPPVGFSTLHEVYDTTLIVGNALFDENFNKENGEQGSAKDIVYYHIPLNEYNGNVSVSARVLYQSLPPKWMQEMFDESTPEIETFRTMYDNADQSAVVIATDTIAPFYVEACEILDVVTSLGDCDSAGQFYINIETESEAIGENGFSVLVNGESFGTFGYAETVQMGPFDGDALTSYTIEVTDNDFANCTSTTVVAPVNCLDTSIDHLIATAIKIRPNPATDIIYVDFDKTAFIDLVEIHSSTGQLLRVIHNIKNGEGIELPITNGVYYLTFISNKGSITKKVVRLD